MYTVFFQVQSTSKEIYTHGSMHTPSTPLCLNCHLAFEMLLSPCQYNIHCIFLALILLTLLGNLKINSFSGSKILSLSLLPPSWMSSPYLSYISGFLLHHCSYLFTSIPPLHCWPCPVTLSFPLHSQQCPSLSTTHRTHLFVAFCLSIISRYPFI